jgi:hypothetical protein
MVKINLITTFKLDFSNPKRIDEILFVLRSNLANPNLALITVILDDSKTFEELKSNFSEEKLNLVQFKKRPTFKDLFSFAVNNEINIVANGDIQLSNQIKRVKLFFSISKSTFIALSRVNLDGEMESEKRGDSQDLWCFWGCLKLQLTTDLDYNLGQIGCDNRLVYDSFRNGYFIINPGKSIRTIHVHLEGTRNYTGQPVPRPYGLIKPRNLILSIVVLLAQKLLSNNLKLYK